MIKYGLISETDARTLEKTIDLICDEFPNEMLQTCEVGVYSGLTSKAIIQYIFNIKKRFTWHRGIDNGKDGQPMTDWFEAATFITGNSNEVYNQLPDESQHLIFIDGCHTFPAVVADFFCYAPKVKVGGFLAFHDTGVHIDKLHGWQGVGDKNDPDMCLGGVRKALKHIGLLIADDISEMWQDKFGKMYQYYNGEGNKQWELVFDQADPNDLAGGLTVFRKMY